MRIFKTLMVVAIVSMVAVACGQEEAEDPTAAPRVVATATMVPTEVPTVGSTVESEATATTVVSTKSEPTSPPEPTEVMAATEPPPPTKSPPAALAPERDLDIVTLLPFDGIRSIDEPRFFSDLDSANELYKDGELVLGVEIDGDARAYSVPLLSSHEIVNDVVGGRPIAVTW